jgi:hypothetical protein
MRRDGRLEGPAPWLLLLERAGIRTVAEVLAAAELVRDLPARRNLRLRAAGHTFHVKLEKRRRAPREAAGIERVARAGVGVAPLAFWGRGRGAGALTGTLDLAPARPLDELLAEGRLAPEGARAALGSLARAAALLHQAHLHHRDLYLNHVFVRPEAPGDPVVLIDLERVTSHRGSLGRAVVKDLAAIESSVPPGTASCRDRARLLSTYLHARGFPAPALLSPLLRRVLAKAARIRRHAPRTPVGEAGRRTSPTP